jgi:hypothetical protein
VEIRTRAKRSSDENAPLPSRLASPRPEFAGRPLARRRPPLAGSWRLRAPEAAKAVPPDFLQLTNMANIQTLLQLINRPPSLRQYFFANICASSEFLP